MRWEALFADLEAQLEAEARQEVLAAVPDLVRAERSQVRLADRLRGAVGGALRVSVCGGHAWEGRLVEAAPEWLLLEPVARRRVLVPVAALRTVSGLPDRVAPPPGRVAARLGWGPALRALARDRAPVHLVLDDAREEGAGLRGVLDAVGADHVDVRPVEGDLGSGRGAAAARLTVPLARVVAVGSAA
ncbi:hypothetical protein [Cellulomonas endophytica]|uniref:hypothetical protein n=1 Tax=Cellulomonas endophytica TaxID=2494735 RepID=UPI001012AF75|nr:hypothetical protein [Cellulomonas endophytica]